MRNGIQYLDAGATPRTAAYAPTLALDLKLRVSTFGFISRQWSAWNCFVNAFDSAFTPCFSKPKFLTREFRTAYPNLMNPRNDLMGLVCRKKNVVVCAIKVKHAKHP